MELNYYQSAPGFKQLADELEGIAACDIDTGIVPEHPVPVVVNPGIALDAHSPVVVSPAIDSINKHIVAAFEASLVIKANNEKKHEQELRSIPKPEPPPTWLPHLDLFDSTAR